MEHMPQVAKPMWLAKPGIKCASLDGVNDKIEIADDSSLALTNDFTFSAWVYPTSTAGAQRFIDRGTIYYMAWDDINNKFQFTKMAGGSGQKLTADSTSDLNTWHHVVGVSSGGSGSGTSNLYVNGVQAVDELGSLGNVEVNTASIFIGSHSSGDYFQGMIGQVGLWSTALSASDVSGIYNLGRKGDVTGSYSSGLIGYYIMNPDHATPDATGSDGIIDRSTNTNTGTISGASLIGANDGTVSGSPESIVVREGLNADKDGLGFPFKDADKNVLRLNGTDYLKLAETESLRITGGLTLEAWIKTSTSGDQYIITRDDNTTRAYYLILQASSYLQMRVDGATDAFAVGDTALNDGSWHHVVGVYVPSTSITLYIDAEVDTASGTNPETDSIPTSLDSGAEEVVIGIKGDLHVDTFFNGLIDEVRIYNRALSPTEITKNYKHGKGKHT